MKNLVEFWKKIKYWHIGILIGFIIGLILLVSILAVPQDYQYLDYYQYPDWLNIIVYHLPGYIFFILIWIPLAFLGIPIGSMEHPANFMFIIYKIFYVIFYTLIGLLISIIIHILKKAIIKK